MMIDEIFDKWRNMDPTVNLVEWPNRCCPGCPGGYLWRLITQALGKNVVMAGSLGGPCIRCAKPIYGGIYLMFSSGVDVGVGMAAAIKKLGKTYTVLAPLGDGALDIAFQKISAAAERNDNLIVLTNDNEAYMNTGVQRSGSTPYGAWTTTTPTGKEENKKSIPEIMIAHKIPYVSTLSTAFHKDIYGKFKKAKEIEGFRYIQCLTPCPTGWRFPPEKAIEIARLAVSTWIWPIYEVVNGEFNLSLKPKSKPVEDYIRAQGRFRNLSNEDIELIQKETDKKRERLLEKDGKSVWL
jgi:pyruvate/2-oxoacid:ferredoxin oxidoreductase beta subunit